MKYVSACHEFAHKLLDLGMSPLALCSPDHEGCLDSHVRGCSSPGKRPLARWDVYQERLPSRPELDDQFGACPPANLGVACGPVSRLVALDVDSLDGLVKLQELSGHDLPDTWQFSTGRNANALRWLYGLPEGHPCPNHHFEGYGLSVLGHGLQTVMPPSTHPTGPKYTFLMGRGPEDRKVAEAPGWLLSYLDRLAPQSCPRTGPKPAGDEVRRIGEGGGRNNYLFRLACANRRLGLTRDAVWAVVAAANESTCDPPLGESEVAHVVDQACRYDPAVVPSDAQAIAIAGSKPRQLRRLEKRAVLLDLNTVEPEPMPWLWPHWLPLRNVACFDGDGGVGKTSCLYDIAARVTRGDAMPDGTAPSFAGPADVVFVSCEDDVRATVVPRFRACVADMTRVGYLERVEGHEPRLVRLPQDWDLVEDEVRRRRPRLLVIDPVMAFFSGNAVSDNEVRDAVATPAKMLAERYELCVVLVRHLNKAVGQSAAYRSAGSYGGFVGASRSAMIVGKHPDEEGVSVLALHKSNLAPPQKSQRFRIEWDTQHNERRVVWLGASEVTADDLVAPKDAVNARKSGGLAAAKEFLLAVLAVSPCRVDQLRDRAFEAGVEWQDVLAAKQALGVVAGPLGSSGPWLWRMP